MSHIKIDHPIPRVIHITMPSQYELTSSFMRLQEFYESPYDHIRDHYFTHEEYIDTYVKETGGFTYFSDWNGFNVPGHVADQWIEMVTKLPRPGLWEKEKQLYDAIKTDRRFYGDQKYYIIGTWTHKHIDHELCHALWYLNEDFREKSTKLLNDLHLRDLGRMKMFLLDNGYPNDENILNDEANAYFSTSSAYDLVGKLRTEQLEWNDIVPLQLNFQKQLTGIRREI